MRAIVSPEDLKRGDLIEPGWKPVEFTEYKEEPASENAKNPGSTNCILYFRVIDGNDKGVILKRLFNETAMGFGKNLYKALNFPYDAKIGYTLTTEIFQSKLGSKLMVYVKRGESNKGNAFNDVADFKSL